MGLSLKVWTVMIKHNMNGFRVPLTLSFFIGITLNMGECRKIPLYYTVQLPGGSNHA